MRNILVAILLLISTTAYAEVEENHFLVRTFGIVDGLSLEVINEFGEKARIETILRSCGDTKRADVLGQSIDTEIILNFAYDKLLETYKDKFSNDEELTIMARVNDRFLGYQVGYSYISVLVKGVQEEKICRMAIDKYYELLKESK